MASAATKKKVEEQNLKTLRELTSVEYNKKCLECSQRGITYADMTTAGFVCVQCSGYLRGLNPPHRVKSISMTTFSQSEIETLKKGGNEAARKVWLGKWNSKRDREPDKTDENAFKQFLITKYERRTWYVSPSELAKEETGKAEAKPEPKLMPPPSTKTTTSERPRGSSQPAVPAQVVNPPASQPSSVPQPTASGGGSKPKMDLLGELEGDPFAPKQPVGGVSVLPQLPPGGVPLTTNKTDDFGAFTGASQSTSSVPSSLTSLPQTSSSASASSASDKYAALASLDETLRDLKVKDEPPSQPVPVPVSQSQSQPFGNYGNANTNPFGASSGSTQSVSNPFTGSPNQHPGMHQQGFGGQAQPQAQGFGGQSQAQGFGGQPQAQGFGGQPRAQGFGGQPRAQGFGGQPQAQGFGGQPQAQGFGGQPQAQGFGGQPQRQPGVQGYGGAQPGFGGQQPTPGVQGFGSNQQQMFQGGGFAGQPQPQQFGGFGQQQFATGTPPNPYQQQQWAQAQQQQGAVRPQGQVPPGSSFGSMQQPQGVQGQWRPQQQVGGVPSQSGQQWGAQGAPRAQFGGQQASFGGAVPGGVQPSGFGRQQQQPAGFGNVPQQQSGGFAGQKPQPSSNQFQWNSSSATTQPSQTRTGNVASSSSAQPAGNSGWSSGFQSSSSSSGGGTPSAGGWSSGLEKPPPQSTWGVQQPQQPATSTGGAAWSSGLFSGNTGAVQQPSGNWGNTPGSGFPASGGQMNWGSGGSGFGGGMQQPQQGVSGGGAQQGGGASANPFAASSQSTTNPFL